MTQYEEEFATLIQKQKSKEPITYIWVIAIPIIYTVDGLIEIYQTGKAFSKYHLLLIAVGLIFVIIYALSHKFIYLKRPSQWDEYIRQLEEIAELDEENQEDESPIGTNS